MNPAPTAPSEHRRAWDAIPWLVAGSASDGERALLQRHLPGCAECRAELAFHRQVHAGVTAVQAGPVETEAGLQRLLARLDVEDAPAGLHAAPTAAAASPTPATTSGPPRGLHPWTRWLAAAVLVQAVGLGALGLAMYTRGQDGDYRTLSSGQTTATVPASIRLVPGPGLDFGALRGLLAQTRLAVVEAAPDGSSLGLAPLDGQPLTTTAALPVLRAVPGVLLAEPTAAAR